MIKKKQNKMTCYGLQCYGLKWHVMVYMLWFKKAPEDKANKRKAIVTMLISNKTDFKTKILKGTRRASSCC